MVPTREDIVSSLTGFPVEHGSDHRLSYGDAVRIANRLISLYPLPHVPGDEDVIVAPSA